MKKKINILITFVLIGALAGAGALVKNNQNVQRGATFATVEALFLPSSKNISIGQKFTTTLMIDTKSRQLTGADLRVKYDQQKLVLESVSVLTKKDFSGGLTWLQDPEEIVISEIDATQGTYTLVGTNLLQEAVNLPNGVVNIVKMNFIATASGEAKVSLDSSYGNVISGYNISGSDQELGIGKINEAIYKIGITCNMSVNPQRLCPSGYRCVTRSDMAGSDGECMNISVTTKPITPTVAVSGAKEGEFCGAGPKGMVNCISGLVCVNTPTLSDSNGTVISAGSGGKCVKPGLTTTPKVTPVVMSAACKALYTKNTSGGENYFKICESNGFDKICFNKKTGVFQGCGRAERDDCTEYNTNAAVNIQCDSKVVSQ